jgi:phage I-like protein
LNSLFLGLNGMMEIYWISRLESLNKLQDKTKSTERIKDLFGDETYLMGELPYDLKGL